MISHNSEEEMYNHRFRLRSAIKQDIMPYTNYTYDFKGMIDYIFYPSQTMTTLGFLGPVDSLWLKENKVVGCPHPHLHSGNMKLIKTRKKLKYVINESGRVRRSQDETG